MRAHIHVVLLLIVVALAVGCSKKDETQPQTTAQNTEQTDEAGGHPDADRTSAHVRPEYYPPPNPFQGISGAIMDTLRLRKARYNITRDQYWAGKGGVLANQYMEVWYPPGKTTVTHGMRVFDEAMPGIARFEQFFGTIPAETAIFRCSIELDEYEDWTGRKWWYYSEIRSDTLYFSPIYILAKRGVASMAIPHEYHQWAIGKVSGYGAPRWLEEGLASYLSEEEELLSTQALEFPDRKKEMTVAQIEQILEEELERESSRLAYYRCFRMVQKLVDQYGEEKIRDFVLLLGQGHSLDEGSQETFDLSYNELLKFATDYAINI